MPENVTRAQTGSEEETIPALLNRSSDIVMLSEQEKTIILAVLQRDDLERRILDTKISVLRREIQAIRKAGALTGGDDQNTICARCKAKFPPLKLPWTDQGQRCLACKFKVCTKCSTWLTNGYRLCILCDKYRQEKILTGEWMRHGQSLGLHGTQLLRALLWQKGQTQPGYEETEGSNYTQRPAKIRDVDTESRTSKNSQSSTETKTNLKGQIKPNGKARLLSLATKYDEDKVREESQIPGCVRVGSVPKANVDLDCELKMDRSLDSGSDGSSGVTDVEQQNVERQQDVEQQQDVEKRQDVEQQQDVEKRQNVDTDVEPARDSNRDINGGPAAKKNSPEQRSQTLAPSAAVTNLRGESVNEEDDDLDELFPNRHSHQLFGSRNSLADSRESVYSVYSDAGEVNYGRIPVTGDIMFSLGYSNEASTLEVHVIQCRDLAPVDPKHNRSDPYVKMYLLPDKTRGSKRKTKIKRHTLTPVFDEVFKYQVTSAELASRTLSLTVWHNDRFGRNDFLGEVTLPLNYYRFDETAPSWYPLQERVVTQDPAICYKGDLFISLKYVPPDMVEAVPKKKSGAFRRKNKEKEKPALGEVHVLVRKAQNLAAMRGAAGSNPFCKGYLLPDASRASKQKTPVIKKTTNPQWSHILIFEGVDQSQLHDYGLELTIWDYEKLSSNDFLGGVRINLGQGVHQEKPVDWMDARGEEIEVWQNMMDRPNEWLDAQLPLRASMSKQNERK